MTIDEVIKYAEKVAEEHTKYNIYGGFESWDKCAEEHWQLAKWLKDYKRLSEQESILDRAIAEINREEKWLAQAGYNAYNVDIAFKSVKNILR